MEGRQGVRDYIPRSFLGLREQKKGWRAGRVSGLHPSQLPRGEWGEEGVEGRKSVKGYIPCNYLGISAIITQW